MENNKIPLEKIPMEKAIVMASNPEAVVYMVQRVYGDTTVEQLSAAEGFYVPAEEKEEKQTSKIDHGRIVALYTANPPRSVKWIADDMGISVPTVISHLRKEGVYEGGKKDPS